MEKNKTTRRNRKGCDEMESGGGNGKRE